MKIILAGGSGHLGRVLCDHFDDTAHEIVILSRSVRPPQGNVRTVRWDGKNTGTWMVALEGADLLVNLTGKNVNCRYHDRNRREILSSRLDSTRVLGTAVRTRKVPPKLWIQSSSATIYRHAEDRFMDETTGEIGAGFSVDVCTKWEQEFNAQETPSTRKVILRTGIVLGSDAGVMPRLINLVRTGLGGRQGNGRQYISWIHEKDVARVIEWICNHPAIQGTFNCTSPDPVRNDYFMRMLRKLYGRTWGLPSPAWLLKIGAWIIGTETELILKSRWVMPTRLEKSGYRFKYPSLVPALQDILLKS